MGRHNSHRKDNNHHAVVQAVERLGYFWWDASQTALGVDGFAVGYGRIIPVEIKDPRSSRKLALSPKEITTHQQLRARHVVVEILTGDDASLDVLRGHARRQTSNFYDPTRNRTACRCFVGGYTVDPSSPARCQLCGLPADEHRGEP